MSVRRTLSLLALGILVLSLLSSCSSANDKKDTGDIQTVKIAAVDWGFEPNNVNVKQGKLKLIIENQGKRMHGFAMEEFHIDEKLSPGESVEKIIDMKQTGTFEFDCSVVCGTLEQHQEMKGTITVK